MRIDRMGIIPTLLHESREKIREKPAAKQVFVIHVQTLCFLILAPDYASVVMMGNIWIQHWEYEETEAQLELDSAPIRQRVLSAQETKF
jgi:hypothetical protein